MDPLNLQNMMMQKMNSEMTTKRLSEALRHLRGIRGVLNPHEPCRICLVLKSDPQVLVDLIVQIKDQGMNLDPALEDRADLQFVYSKAHDQLFVEFVGTFWIPIVANLLERASDEAVILVWTNKRLFFVNERQPSLADVVGEGKLPSTGDIYTLWQYIEKVEEPENEAPEEKDPLQELHDMGFEVDPLVGDHEGEEDDDDDDEDEPVDQRSHGPDPGEG